MAPRSSGWPLRRATRRASRWTRSTASGATRCWRSCPSTPRGSACRRSRGRRAAKSSPSGMRVAPRVPRGSSAASTWRIVRGVATCVARIVRGGAAGASRIVRGGAAGAARIVRGVDAPGAARIVRRREDGRTGHGAVAPERSSAQVRTPDGVARLMCKGADNIVLGLAKEGDEGCAKAGGRDVLQKALSDFATEGLRTLVLAQRDLTDDECAAFQKRWRAAETAAGKGVDRAKLLAEAAATVERDLEVVGATAIEDKLQDGAPDTIAELAKAGIKLWALRARGNTNPRSVCDGLKPRRVRGTSADSSAVRPRTRISPKFRQDVQETLSKARHDVFDDRPGPDGR